ncbi:MAG: hypothetical protein PT116_18000 [Aphanizomenon gracile PMC638.10]|nr:hypothetical protein [Aphanizomenon gracile PMC638.10]
MNTIRYAGVVAFIDWISRTYPEIRSLRDTTEDQFLKLTVEYEAKKGLIIDENHAVYMKWRSTHWVFSDSSSDHEALQKLRWVSESMEKRKFLDSPKREELSEAGVKIRPGCDPRSRDFDLLERYRSVPNHAMFLYTSEDTLLDSYIRDHWAALDGLSGEICDIHVSLIQLLGGADAYSQFDEIKSIPGLEKMDAKDLPSIHIWSQNASLRVLLSPFQDEESLKRVFRIIFSELHSSKLPLSELQALELKNKVLKCFSSLPQVYQQITGANVGRDIVQVTNNFFGRNDIMTKNIPSDSESKQTVESVELSGAIKQTSDAAKADQKIKDAKGSEVNQTIRDERQRLTFGGYSAYGKWAVAGLAVIATIVVFIRLFGFPVKLCPGTGGNLTICVNQDSKSK